jgi:branched-chain amino acid transport system substrate-binding protein
MRGSVLASSRAICACISLAAAGIAGCGTSGSSSVTVSGKTLTIYASAPTQTSDPQAAQDVLDAEQLALRGTSGVGGFTLQFRTVRGKPSDNARSAIQNQNAIAYLGETPPGASADTLGITNAEDLLQVSPTDTAVELTQATSAVPGSPGVYYESLKAYGRTFARVVPNSAAEAKAQVQEMQSLGVKKLYVTSDGSPYGSAIAQAVRGNAGASIAVVSSQAGADAIFYGAAPGSASAAARVFNSAVATDPRIKLFGSSSLENPAFVAALSSAAQRNVYVSAPGFLATELPAAGKQFVSEFTATYHRAPGPEAIFGYEAMKAVLAVLGQAGSSANNRATVARDFLSIKNRNSVLGTYSISAAGDTSLGAFVFSRVKGGKLVATKAVSVAG